MLGRGVGRKGCGWPRYCWQEVAPFFPDGETEAQGGLGTCPKSLTVSQLLGRGSLHWEARSHRPWSPSHWGARTGRKGQRAQGCLEGNTWPFQGGMVGGGGEVFAWHWAGPSPVREPGRGGHSGENSISGKTGIHFKISAQRGQQGCSQTRQGPWHLQFFPPALQPSEGPWPGCARRDTASIRRRGWEGWCPHHSPQSGVWGARGRARLSRTSPAHPQPYPRPSFTSVSALPRHAARAGRRTPGFMRVCSTSEKLLRWEKENQVKKGPPITRDKRDWWAGGGEGLARRGFLGLGVGRGPIGGLWTPCCLARLGAGSGHGPSHLVMGEVSI